MKGHLKRFAVDEGGATAIEYGLIAALISIGIIAASRSMGSQISAKCSTRSRTRWLAPEPPLRAMDRAATYLWDRAYDAVQATIKVAGVEGAAALVALTLGLGLYVLLGGRRTE